MKVAIIHELLVKLGGAERVAKVLMEMFPEAPIFTLLYNEKTCGSVFPKKRVRVAPWLQKAYRMGIPRRALISWMNTAVENFNLTEYDLVISSSSAFAHGVLTLAGTKHICYCHSPARYLWDQTFSVQEQQAHRGALSGAKSFLLPRIFHTLRQWDAVAAGRPDILLANSKTVQQRISKYWRKPSQVLFPPVRVREFSAQKEHGEYFLIVSALSPFKNIDLAVRVFSRLPKHKLVIIGDGVERKRLEALSGENVEFLGRKSDGVVKEYLQNCRALLFPGEDDFGIVPVEAMACGKPVIALARGGATETVLAEQTGIFFDEPVEYALEHALIRFFQHEPHFDTHSIRKHALLFSEESFREGILKNIHHPS
ncbi:glycosyltransferase [Candidatus Peregrinibacteria bacterium]|nr:MAG: glycosyltransferase [Candidatus Peregrinibacteria bacterium]